jgi:phenylacetate-CoA ligase
MVVIRGVNVYPTAIDEWVRRLGDVGEYRVTEDRRGALAELSVELEAGTETAARLETHLRDELALRIPVKAVPRGTLPRFEHKARRWRRLN